MTDNGQNGTGDITFPARHLPDIAEALAAIFPLQPPPTPRGRYVLAKIAQRVALELPPYTQQKWDLMQRHGAKDEKGETIVRRIPLPNGQTRTEVDPVDRVAFNAEDANLGSTPVVLAGLQPLSAADLGTCPVPQGAYTVLLGVVFKDEPPEG